MLRGSPHKTSTEFASESPYLICELESIMGYTHRLVTAWIPRSWTVFTSWVPMTMLYTSSDHYIELGSWFLQYNLNINWIIRIIYAFCLFTANSFVPVTTERAELHKQSADVQAWSLKPMPRLFIHFLKFPSFVCCCTDVSMPVDLPLEKQVGVAEVRASETANFQALLFRHFDCRPSCVAANLLCQICASVMNCVPKLPGHLRLWCEGYRTQFNIGGAAVSRSLEASFPLDTLYLDFKSGSHGIALPKRNPNVGQEVPRILEQNSVLCLR